MTTRVTRPDEIKINGVAFRVSGGITLSMINAWPEKSISGDYNENTQPLRSIHSWHDWRGGIGLDRWKGPEDDVKAWYSECDTRYQNHLLLPPLRTNSAAATPAVSAVPTAIGVLNGVPYVAFLAEVHRYTVGSDSWSASLVTLAGTASPPVTLTLSGTVYLVFPHAAGYAYTSNGTAWTARSYTATAYMVDWDDRLWGITTAGRLWYTFTPGSGEVLDALLPLGTDETVRGLFIGLAPSGERTIFAMSSSNIFIHDAENTRFVAFHDMAPVTRDIRGAAWRDANYYALGLSVFKQTPGVPAIIEQIGVDQIDGFPAGYEQEDVLTLVPSAYDLLAGTDPQASTDQGLLLAYNQTGWRVLAATSDDQPVTVIKEVATSGTLRIYFSYNTSNRVSYITMPPTTANPKHLAGYAYAASAMHKTPWFDAAQNEVTKTLLEIVVSVVDVTSAETVAVDIAYDYLEGTADVAYTTLGTINNTTVCTDGDSIATNGGSGRVRFVIDSDGGVGGGTNSGFDFNAVRIKLTLARGATTTLSPDVESLTVVYRKKLQPKYQIQCKLDLTKEYMGLSPREMRRLLVAAAERSTLTEVVYRNDSDGTRNYYCDLLLNGIEKTGDAEDGIVELVATEI